MTNSKEKYLEERVDYETSEKFAQLSAMENLTRLVPITFLDVINYSGKLKISSFTENNGIYRRLLIRKNE